ncbi:MAG: tetratricopeptide repeat protein, partial [bacterium]|nr:tetratricopeptide repeat protein [bacterium]
MSSIYYVTIEPVGKEDCFRVTWHDEGNNRINSFEQAPEITIEDTLRLSRMAKFQLGIGQKLFRFLDGETHTFRRALDRAHRKAEILQLHLSTCKQTHDWPFELLADTGTFLLPHRVHLVRNVSTRSEGKTIIPRDRPLKLLFMACSALDVKPELDFEQEEEAIFEITGNLPIDMDVEDSGTLEGLRSQLEQEQYDVVHLSGFTGIAKNGRPYFIMEDETGYQHKVLPYRLWNEALIENPPRLLFLSGSRTGKAKDRHSTTGTVSFARMMKKNYNIPAVLEWGKSVRDAQAIHAGKMIFHDLSRGKSILQAVQRARFDMLKKFPHTPEPAWPLLRLFSSGMPLNAIVKENQRKQPKIQVIKHVYLKNSRVKVLADGFVGRRRQLQTSLRALKQDVDKVGVMLLGTGGLGKSCLAGKICDRFNDYTLIIVHGRLNTITLEPALEDAFIKAQDEKGQQILSQEEKMIDKLSELCATSFKEKNYLFLLDDFEQNLEGVDKGHPGSLLPEAADLLNVLLHHLPSCNKKTQLIITSRYTFPLAPQYGVSIGSLCQGVWLTGFRGAEQRKKARALENITNYPDQSLVPRLLAAGHGNPRLMEWIDLLVGEMKKAEVMPLLEAVKNRQEEFIRQHVIRELLQREEKEFELFLCRFSIYRRPVQMEGVKQVTGKTWLFKWKKLLGRGMDLSLIEHDQARHSYQVTPLLREELSENTKDIESCHKAAFNYYKEIYRTKGTVTSMLPHLDYVFKANLSRISKKLSTPYPDFKLEQDIYDSFDPILTEELIFHALGCGKEEIASKEGWRLINQLRDKLALQESQRVGKLILAEKKLPCSNADDALLLNNLAATMHELRDYRQSISYLEQSLTIGRAIYGGEMHYDIARNFINLGGAWRALGEYKKAIDYYRQALPIFKNVFDDKHPTVAITLHHLGAALHDSGNYREAVGYHEQALKITRDALGENQTLVMEGLSRLGDCWVELGELEKALDYFEQAKSIALVLYGERHPHLAFVFNSIGLAWSKLGEFNKA